MTLLPIWIIVFVSNIHPITRSSSILSINASSIFYINFVTLKAFYPLVLIVSHKFGVLHQLLKLPSTLGSIIFIQLLRSTVTISLAQSDCLPRNQHIFFYDCWHLLYALPIYNYQAHNCHHCLFCQSLIPQKSHET